MTMASCRGSTVCHPPSLKTCRPGWVSCSSRVSETPRLGLELARGEIRAVLWATGFRPDYSWLDVPVLDRRGQIKHDGGMTESPGMVVMGLP